MHCLLAVISAALDNVAGHYMCRLLDAGLSKIKHLVKRR